MKPHEKFQHVGLKIIGTFLMLWGATLATEYTFNRAQADSYFVDYFSVELRNPPADKSRPLRMQSIGIVRRALDLQHRDILRCQTPEGEAWRFVSQQLVTVRYKTPMYMGFDEVPDGAPDNARVTSGRWDYRGALPRDASLCKVEANITVNPSLGVEKRLQLESAPFELQ